MFIGDGMGNPQVTATQYDLGSIANPDSPFPVPAELSFTTFPYLGLVTTYDASSFCPDSASTATSMASGEKTLSGVINCDVTLTTPFKLITEYAKEAGKKIGVISSVDHETPAAYYARQPSRNDYYEIAVQGITGDTVDFLVGGGFKKPAGANRDQTDILELARENGWTITGSNAEVRALNAGSGRVLAVNPVLQDSMAIHYTRLTASVWRRRARTSCPWRISSARASGCWTMGTASSLCARAARSTGLAMLQQRESALTVTLIDHYRMDTELAMLAVLGALAGTLVTCSAAWLLTLVLKLDGGDQPYGVPLLAQSAMGVDTRGVYIGMMFLANSGALMDLSMDISASMEEIRLHRPDVSRGALIRSGMSVGRSVLGTMTTTLMLAYSGNYLSMLIYFVGQGTPITDLLNLKYVTSQLLNTLVGSFGLVAAAPLTAVIAAAGREGAGRPAALRCQGKKKELPDRP